MKREDIEKAAGEYSGSVLGFKDNPVVMAKHKAFTAGADWRINSVWHDASEIPEANKRVLVCFENLIGEYVYYRIRIFKPNVLKKWNMGNFSLDRVLYWCYLDDLLPERNDDMWEDLDYKVCGEIEYECETGIILPKGSIKKLIGRDLDWNNEPVELKEEQP